MRSPCDKYVTDNLCGPLVRALIRWTSPRPAEPIMLWPCAHVHNLVGSQFYQCQCGRQKVCQYPGRILPGRQKASARMQTEFSLATKFCLLPGSIPNEVVPGGQKASAQTQNVLPPTLNARWMRWMDEWMRSIRPLQFAFRSLSVALSGSFEVFCTK